MNDIQGFIDNQLGIASRLNYDNALKRLVVNETESFCNLQIPIVAESLEQDPPIFACRFAELSGYEHVLALANEDGKIAIQDTSKTSRRISRGVFESYQCHDNAVFDLAWMPQHMNFVTVSGDHTAALWDFHEGCMKRLLVFTSHTCSVKTAVFRPTSPGVFATGARDGNILVWDTRVGPQCVLIMKPENKLNNCHSSFIPKTPGSHSKRLRPDTIRATSITGLVFQDDMTLMSCGECDGNIKVWDLRKNYTIYKNEPLPKHSIPYCGSSTKNGYTNLTLDSTGIRLYASCMDNVIYCFNVSTYSALPEQRYVGHENSTFYIKSCLSPDSKYLISGSSDKNAYIWNVKFSEPLVKLTGHWAEVTCAAWCRTGETKIVTCSDDARHNIWRVGREVQLRNDLNDFKGVAEVVPRKNVTNQWSVHERTPVSLKRRQLTITPCSGKRPRRAHPESQRKTKRCLTEIMNAAKETNNECDLTTKRLRLDLPSTSKCNENQNSPSHKPAGVKRRGTPFEEISPNKKQNLDNKPETGIEWSYISSNLAGVTGTFLSPTKKYEVASCRRITPKKSPNNSVSPQNEDIHIFRFTTPTKNLPNFVLDGEAPHLKLMSPVKKKQETSNWLTLITKERRERGHEVTEKPQSVINNSPKSISDSKPKGKSLLNYFNVINKK